MESNSVGPYQVFDNLRVQAAVAVGDVNSRPGTESKPREMPSSSLGAAVLVDRRPERGGFDHSL